MSDTKHTVEFKIPFTYTDAKGESHEGAGVTVFTLNQNGTAHHATIGEYGYQAFTKMQEMGDPDQLKSVDELHTKGMTENEVVTELEGEDALNNHAAFLGDFKTALGADFLSFAKRC